jgi:hypothetical protein
MYTLLPLYRSDARDMNDISSSNTTANKADQDTCVKLSFISFVFNVCGFVAIYSIVIGGLCAIPVLVYRALIIAASVWCGQECVDDPLQRFAMAVLPFEYGYNAVLFLLSCLRYLFGLVDGCSRLVLEEYFP